MGITFLESSWALSVQGVKMFITFDLISLSLVIYSQEVV